MIFSDLVVRDMPLTLYINGRPSVCSVTNMQMYAEFLLHGSSMTQVAEDLTNSMVRVTAWLRQCYLQLSVSKTVCMFFTKEKTSNDEPDVCVPGKRLKVVYECKLLRIMIDSKSSFKVQMKKGCNQVKLNLSKYVSTVAAKVFMHYIVIADMSYFLTH